MDIVSRKSWVCTIEIICMETMETNCISFVFGALHRHEFQILPCDLFNCLFEQ